MRIYRGQPDSLRDPRGYGANLRQAAKWKRSSPDRVDVVHRTLLYPAAFPRERPREKGIDVALAIDFVTMADNRKYDIGVIMSTDTDLKPALELVAAMRGDPYPRAAVASWSAPTGHSRRLSIAGHKLWCHWLDHGDYAAVADPTDYTQELEQ